MNPFAQALSAALELCIATQQVAKQRAPVGFMYREEAVFEHDSGWRFFAGDESDEYTADNQNFQVCSLSDILAANPEIQTFLQETAGAWEWQEPEGFVPVADWQPEN